MGKYYGVGGSRIGKVGEEVYEMKNGTNVVRLKNSYIPVNNAWIKRDEFKRYVLSLLEVGIPQIYVLDELPERVLPYALLFIKNGNKRDVYVDKDLTRTKINIGEGGGGEFDPVDIVNEIPQDPDPDKLFFVKKQEQSKNSTVYEIYASDNGVLTKIDIDLSQAVDQANAYTDSQVTDLSEEIDTKTQPITDLKTKSLKNVYNTTLEPNKMLASTKDGYVTASPLGFADAYDTINGIRTKALKNAYQYTLSGNKVLISDSTGYVAASSINALTAQNVINGVSTGSLKNIYNTTLDTDRVIVSDGDGYVKASNTTYNTLDVTLSGIRTKALANVYNSYLSANKNVITDGNGRISYANMPHLYMHYVHYNRSGTGEVAFVIYNTTSTSLSTVNIHNYLYSLGCYDQEHLFPATGFSPGGYPIQGVYATVNSSEGLVDRGFKTVAYFEGYKYETYYTSYSALQKDTVTTIF